MDKLLTFSLLKFLKRLVHLLSILGLLRDFDENMSVASKWYRAWLDCMDVQAGLALYWWQRLLLVEAGLVLGLNSTF